MTVLVPEAPIPMLIVDELTAREISGLVGRRVKMNVALALCTRNPPSEALTKTV